MIIDVHAQECYLRYRQTLDNESFTELYIALADVKSWHKSKVSSSGAGDVYDAESSFDDVLFGLASREGITDIRRLLYVSMRFTRLKLYRKNTKWQERIYYPESDAEFGGTVDRIEPDRTELIRALIDRSGEKTAALIADMALRSNAKESITSISGRAGLHHNTALRSLRRLRRYYNVEIDGDLAEYLA
ncbi:hypothetical protein JCM10914A_11080 [Paenibacillus sp. JCM 10914]|uniref:hypothetical protein n=1 Tax=Paenibacillus sp. JCM 10914 TaxID=1236974 RepID=UPI0003CCAB1C|nr:hypothetical protein [Paenibacillus sp. JCM 10914]GAE08147.1 hypothetical protein JCM10914_4413 [Paenibacillus sp. JCM 10914]